MEKSSSWSYFFRLPAEYSFGTTTEMQSLISKEVKKIKKTAVISTAFLLVLILAIAAPVMAEPTKGQKVDAQLIITSMPSVSDGSYFFTPSGGFHGKGLREVYSSILVIDNNPYAAVFIIVEHGSWNPVAGNYRFSSNDVLYISSEGSSDGFAGKSEVTLYGFDLATGMCDSMKIHSVYQGFGSFAEQTLTLSYEGAFMAGNPTGYCLKG
jgi:hypothetical protein